MNQLGVRQFSLTSHTLQGSGHAATIELSPRQKLGVTNEIRTLRRLNPLSWNSLVKECPLTKERPPLTFMYRVKVYSNECLPLGKIHVQFEKYSLKRYAYMR